jgi:hypothetical protein
MPLVSYRASAEAVLREIHEVADLRQSAKQVLESDPEQYVERCLCLSGPGAGPNGIRLRNGDIAKRRPKYIDPRGSL